MAFAESAAAEVFFCTVTGPLRTRSPMVGAGFGAGSAPNRACQFAHSLRRLRGWLGRFTAAGLVIHGCQGEARLHLVGVQPVLLVREFGHGNLLQVSLLALFGTGQAGL